MTEQFYGKEDGGILSDNLANMRERKRKFKMSDEQIDTEALIDVYDNYREHIGPVPDDTMNAMRDRLRTQQDEIAKLKEDSDYDCKVYHSQRK